MPMSLSAPVPSLGYRTECWVWWETYFEGAGFGGVPKEGGYDNQLINKADLHRLQGNAMTTGNLSIKTHESAFTSLELLLGILLVERGFRFPFFFFRFFFRSWPSFSLCERCRL